jgi:hypothetical protein
LGGIGSRLTIHVATHDGTAIVIFSLMFPLFFGLVAAQQDCGLTNYQPCKDQAQVFLDATCTPLLARNRTHYDTCLCYHAVNLGFCYSQCPNNSTVQAEFNGGIANSIVSYCGAVRLNPQALPQPPVWQTFNPSTTPSSPPPTGTNAGTSPSATATRSSAFNSGSSFALALGFVALLL